MANVTRRPPNDAQALAALRRELDSTPVGSPLRAEILREAQAVGLRIACRRVIRWQAVLDVIAGHLDRGAATVANLRASERSLRQETAALYEGTADRSEVHGLPRLKFPQWPAHDDARG